MNSPLESLSLGPLDADDDANLHEYFVPFGDFGQLRNKNRFIVVGPKGTGKSAIRKHLFGERNQQKGLVVDLNEEYGFSLNKLSSSSPNEIKNKMKGYFMAVVLNYLSNSPLLSATRKTRLKALDQVIPFFKKLLEPIKFKAVFVEYAIGELFSENKQADLLTILDTSVSSTIIHALGNQDLWVLIDDVDNIFIAKENVSPLSFVEGLIYAASDLNTKISNKAIWIVILLRSEIYEELTRKAKELDKEERYTWEIAWNSDALLRFLAERIRWAFKEEQGKSLWEYLTRLFDVNNEKEALELHGYLVERIINGPRDLLLLVDLARNTAANQGADKISLKHIQESEFEYGKKKLRQITSNFQRIYEDVDFVVERLFRKAKQVDTRDGLENKINNELLTNPQAMKNFSELRWLFTCTPFRFLEILYRIGFIGYWNSSDQRYMYVLEKSNPDQALINSAQIKIHSAFTVYLQLKSSI
jgi:hypothetical protein